MATLLLDFSATSASVRAFRTVYESPVYLCGGLAVRSRVGYPFGVVQTYDYNAVADFIHPEC